MSRRTSFDELYDTLGGLLETATGRPWWRKAGLQTRPKQPYALIYMTETEGVEKQVVENIDIDFTGTNGETFEQVVWNTMRIDCRFEFYGTRTSDTPLQAATRAKAMLFLEERLWDLEEIAKVSGQPRIIDISGVFREDIEPRAELRFYLWANVADPLPLPNTEIFDIDTQRINVIHDRRDDVLTTIEVDVINTENDDSDS